MQLFRRESALKESDQVRAVAASDNGIETVVNLPSLLGHNDSTFTLDFEDGSAARVMVFQWGVYEGVVSDGISSGSHEMQSALIAGSLSNEDSMAFVLGNLDHGLVLTGESDITGDVVVGPRGVTTGTLRDVNVPPSLPLHGRIHQITVTPHLFDASLLAHQVALAKSYISGRRRTRTAPDYSGKLVNTSGYLRLNDLSDSVSEVFSSGSLRLAGTIMKRGPPLTIVVNGHIELLPGASLVGPIALYSTDSISIPSKVSIINCILVSPKSIELQSGASVTAQLFSPVIRCLPNSAANYPSALVSVSLSDTGGVDQSINIESGVRVTGSILMNGGVGISKEDAVIDLEQGSLVTGEVYTDCYLTLDGEVNGFVRAFDLYFYSSPTTYLGWMRKGSIDRDALPKGTLRPVGTSASERGAILTWM